ncbi:hypothetical protein TNIN_258201 [Trichonephila inaurata madagascariensis]|uniref:C3H1-type domain-containing protein n=1 Tax=Trichonephila inaurata madagascariensis TaxID=2747483 RepID=A0A8X6WQL2_9ARAC|nr:hypothetical protein TNIN_258201 [Trichonephila inaurata madagascariensis]
MGKQYYCDYCGRSFADGAENRKKHLVSAHHQKLRKAHYDMFKDAATILEENKLKRPCRKFHSEGYCEFGTNCKYSHLTQNDVRQLIEQANNEKLAGKKPRSELDIDSWLQTKILKMNQSSDNLPACPLNPVLPSILSSIPNLPPSLIPCTPSEFLSLSKNNRPQWG